jgi:hypothetical protein
MNFIKSRLNRDNFWNLMFWVAINIGLSCAVLCSISGYNVLAFIGFWATLIGVPYAVKQACLVSCNSESSITNCPKGFWVIVATAIGTGLLGAVLDTHFKQLNQEIALFIVSTTVFLIPTMFFILKNCPIGVIFKKPIIQPISQEELSQRRTNSSSFDHPVSAFDKMTKPQYCYLPQNNFYKR